MAKIQVIISSDGESYSLGDEHDETAECVGWGEPLEFGDKLYLADVSDDGNDVTLYRLSEMSEAEFEAVSEDEDEGEEGEEETDEEEEREPIAE